jgi:hypothetical protein
MDDLQLHERRLRQCQDELLDLFMAMVRDMGTKQGIHSSRIREAFNAAILSIERKEQVLGED